MKIGSRLVLGTAQLGMEYGIANTTGHPDIKKACAIVQSAWEGGIREFDTAQAYGISEKVLGKAIAENNLNKRAMITTKLNSKINHLSKRAVFNSVEQSLRNIGISKFKCIMMHGEHVLQQWNNGTGKIMDELIGSNLVEWIGISVYSPHAALRAMENESITAIQIPSNILDRRFEKAGLFGDNLSKKTQMYVRSVFLQGLLLSDPDTLPSKIMYTRPILNRFAALSRRYDISKLELALGYAKEAYIRAKIIIGVETPEQISENLRVWKSRFPTHLVQEAEKSFQGVDEKILNPFLWPN